MFYLLFTAFSWATPSQSLVYDLTANGRHVGTRTIKIEYRPATDEYPYESRYMIFRTDIHTKIAGQDVTYKQYATGIFALKEMEFEATNTLNDDSFEIQGRQRSNQNWIIHEIVPSGVTTTEYSKEELSNISLSLFDPGQAEKWQQDDIQRLYYMESSSIDEGSWSKGDDVSIQSMNRTVLGHRYFYNSGFGSVTGVWSDTGILLKGDIELAGLNVTAKIQNVPGLLEVGTTSIYNTFGGVTEEEL